MASPTRFYAELCQIYFNSFIVFQESMPFYAFLRAITLYSLIVGHRNNYAYEVTWLHEKIIF